MVSSWIRYWGPAILMMVLIFIASAIPGSDLSDFGAWDLASKKGGHAVGYALLAAAYVYALHKNRDPAFAHFLAAFLLACAYAASDEFHQKFTPGRTSSLDDVFVDMAGAAVGLWLWHWRLRRKKAGLRNKDR